MSTVGLANTRISNQLCPKSSPITVPCLNPCAVDKVLTLPVPLHEHREGESFTHNLCATMWKQDDGCRCWICCHDYTWTGSILLCVPLICVFQYRQYLHPGRWDVTLPPEREYCNWLRQRWVRRFAWWTSRLPIPQAAMDGECSDGIFWICFLGIVNNFAVTPWFV